MSRRGINKFYSTQKCCKPSGRIFWVGCSKCRKCFHIKCVGITKKQSKEEDFFCRPCQVVDTGAPLPLTVDTLIAVTKAIPTILKRVPKHPRIPLVKLPNEALDGIVAKPHDESCWVSFFQLWNSQNDVAKDRNLIWGVSYARESTKVQLLAILSSRVNWRTLNSSKNAKKRWCWSPPSSMRGTSERE